MNIADTNAETMKHANSVRVLLSWCAAYLHSAGWHHDNSKFISPEVEVFAENTEKLSSLTYGSDEYKACLEAMKPALDHHYAENTHHPEHFENGVLGMTLFELIEMMCDWKAATLRHADGDFNKSIEINAKRFNIP
jgi:hypothetical protein